MEQDAATQRGSRCILQSLPRSSRLVDTVPPALPLTIGHSLVPAPASAAGPPITAVWTVISAQTLAVRVPRITTSSSIEETSQECGASMVNRG
jgi:hypothetical protein